MIRREEHLLQEHVHNLLCVFVCVCVLTHLLMIASVLIHFVSCANQFPVNISRNLTFSVSLGLRKIQLF